MRMSMSMKGSWLLSMRKLFLVLFSVEGMVQSVGRELM
jgi:hypothetical protein